MGRADYRNIEEETRANRMYRRVLRTYPGKTQLVLMSLEPGEDVPAEIHRRAVQFIRVEGGTGRLDMGGRSYRLRDGVSVMVPPNTEHYIRNTSRTKRLQMYILYSPPQDAANVRQRRQPR